MANDPLDPRAQAQASAPPETPEQRMLRQRSPMEDCLPCRLTGALALCGLAGFVLFKAQVQIRKDRKLYPRWEYNFRRFGVLGISFLLFSVGVRRAFN